MNTDLRPRRWFRFAFRLRSLFVWITLLALAAAWVAYERGKSRRQHEIAAALHRYAPEIHFAGPYDDLRKSDDKQSWWRRMAGSILGTRVIEIRIGGPQLTELSDISALSELTMLRDLHLMNTQVNDLSPLAGLMNLRSVEVLNEHVSDIAPLVQLKNLTALGLYSARVSNLSPIAEFTRLRFLNLGRTQVSDLTPLTGLTELKQLDLSNAKGVVDVSPLRGLAKLEILELRGTQVEEDQFRSLKDALPNCKIEWSPPIRQSN